MVHQTRYAQSEGVSIAYQVIGESTRDLVIVPGIFSDVEWWWEEPHADKFFTRLSEFARVILFDKRGTGLSDRVPVATLEQRMDDVRAVMDAAGSERAAVLGISEGGAMSCLFGATYPDRTTGLILYGAYAKEPDYMTPEQMRAYENDLRQNMGDRERWRRSIKHHFAPSMADDEQFLDWFAKLARRGSSPGALVALARMNNDIDVQGILPSIRVPTLVLQREGDLATPAIHAKYLAENIPGAKLVMLKGSDHLPMVGDSDAVIDEIEEFLTGVRDPLERNRVLATVLFTDIVGSTERALELGDRKWRELLERHHSIIRKQLARFRGSEVDTAGDGFFATFDGPARGIHCAQAIRQEISTLGITVRAGLHTGECEIIGDKLGGIAVHIGARIMGLAHAEQILVSSTVKDLVVGSGIQFADAGTHALKGIPGDWHLYQVANA